MIQRETIKEEGHVRSPITMDPRRRVAPAQPANAHQRRLPEKIDLTRHMPPSRHQLTTDTR